MGLDNKVVNMSQTYIPNILFRRRKMYKKVSIVSFLLIVSMLMASCAKAATTTTAVDASK